MNIDLFGYDRVKVAIERIRQFCPPEGYYLAFSGGKDSVVLKELTIKSEVKFDAHYSVTTIDPPELVRFIKHHHPNVKWDRPKVPFLALVASGRGFPLRTKRWCCSEYKEKGGSGRIILTGIRKQESFKRSGRKMIEVCLKDSSKSYVNPIIDWSENDVWEFIKENKIPYCSLYDEGFKRLGCVMCPMNYNRIKEAARWPMFRKSFELAFIKLWEKNYKRESYKRWENGKEMFDWWLHDKRIKENPDQTVMFE